MIELNRRELNQRRLWCAGNEPVFGEMAALTRFPWKWIWFADAPPRLFDLSRDPGELRDASASEPEIARTLGAELERRRAQARARPPRAEEGAGLSEAGVEALRALGYLE